MRTSYFAGISLVLLFGCGTDPEPGTGTPGATTTPQTTAPANGGSAAKTSATTKKTGQGGSAAKTTNGQGGSEEEGGAAADGGAAEGGKATGGKASGGTKSSGGSGSKAVGGSSGSSKTSSAGGAGGKSSGSASNTGGKSGAATGGTSSATTSTSSGGEASFKCDNLSAAAGASGQAKPSGAAGGLKVLDWAGFKSAISYTFDDSNSSQINNYKAMNDAGGHYTFYMQTGKSDASNAIWKTALQDGHELGNHTSDHQNCPSSSGADTAQSFIKTNFGVTAYAFAAPNGSTACQSVSPKFLTNRSVSDGTMNAGDVASLTWMPAYVATTGTNSNMNPVSGKWKVICIHGFTGGTDGAYQAIPLDSFTSAVKAAVSGGSWVETATNVAAYQVGQNLISKASGSPIKWTKPSVFPPNMCVRVTTTGGKVTQKGAEVPWDDHGYYQISLDAGEVTVE